MSTKPPKQYSSCIDPALPAADEYKATLYEKIERENARNNPISIRIHRCCSWLRRAQAVAAGKTEEQSALLDDELILLWIAFNALYGVWDKPCNKPLPDLRSVRVFLDLVMKHDHDNRLKSFIARERSCAVRLFDNVYLDHYYWRGLNDVDDDDETWVDMPQKGRGYLSNNPARAIDRLVLYRIYTLRCQLVHGGATHGGRLNRDSVADSGTLLHGLLDCFLRIVIDNHDIMKDAIGPICYPPHGEST